MNEQVKEYQVLVNNCLEKQSLPEEPVNLYEPIRYFLSLGGKRMRPILSLLSLALYRKPSNIDAEIVSSIELFHNFTLLHDDIMDEAPLRRGKPTVHTKWDSNIAILSGDALMVKAYQKLSFLEKDFREIFFRFNQTAIEVCEGQQIDMDLESVSNPTREQYLNMIRLKTAVLLGYSSWLGAKLGGATESESELLYKVGTDSGIAFQLMDDYLDAFGDPKDFGKKPGGDIRAGKKTILWILATEKKDDPGLSRLYEIYERNERTEEDVKEALSIFNGLNVGREIEEMINDKFRNVEDALNSLQVDKKSLDSLIGYFRALGKRSN